MPIDIISQLGIFTSSIDAAIRIAGTVFDVRDNAKLASALSSIRDELLKSQEARVALHSSTITLLEEKLEMAKKLSEINESVADRKRYTPLQVAPGTVTYGCDVHPASSRARKPKLTQPKYYVCQPCLDNIVSPRKVILRPEPIKIGFRLKCPVCSDFIDCTIDPRKISSVSMCISSADSMLDVIQGRS